MEAIAMRVPRVRFTVRRMMIAVAVVGAMMGWFALQRRAERFQQRAAAHGRKAEAARDYMALGIYNPTLTKHHAYHEEMRRKYDRGVLHPWLFVAPDPPEPKWPPTQ